MPSPNNGPYRSRLFNLINRQSRQLMGRSVRATRHLKVTAIWGLQILLYPVYLLVQASLSASRQLLQEAQSGWPTLKALAQSQPPQTPLTADTPIQRVLKEVKILPLPTPSGPAVSPPNFLSVVSGEWSVEKTAVNQQAIANNGQLINNAEKDAEKQTNQQGWVIQGVATLLPERTLVLVSVENQILDILTPQQQHKLSSRITWEVANLMRQRRLWQKTDLKKAAPRLSTLDHPPLFLPLRLFWRLMAWVQTSPVAITVNLFGESALVSSSAKSATPIQPPPAITKFLSLVQRQSSALQNRVKVPQETLTTLDRQVAQLEAHPLVTDSKIAIALRERTHHLFQKLKSGHSATPTETSETHPFWLQGLIYAAINYFFGRRGSNLSPTDTSESSSLPPNPQGQAQQLAGDRTISQTATALPPTEISTPDPWLTWDELFGNPLTKDLTQNPAHPAPYHYAIEGESPNSSGQLPEGFNSKTPLTRGNPVWRVIKSYLQAPKSLSKISAPLPPKPIVPTAKVKTRPSLSSTKVPFIKRTQNSANHQIIPDLIKAQNSNPKDLPPSDQESPTIDPPTPREDSHQQKDHTLANSPPPNPSFISVTKSAATEANPEPDWIETQATPTGYVKHPLERVLEWLDLGMLWLEEFLLKLWRWVRRLWRRL